MKERPIIFNTEMVKAILAGRKTQTRRVIKPQPKSCDHKKVFQGCEYGQDEPTKFYEVYPGEWACEVCGKGTEQDPKSDNPFDAVGIKCPYGKAGDRLWVRETWAAHESYDGRKPSDIPEGVTIECKIAPDAVETNGNGHRKIREGERGKWRPSIFMPRWASRILLEITEVRVERLQEITEKDAKAEGCWGTGVEATIADSLPLYSAVFGNLWDSINAKRGHGWDKNDWVWPISFKKTERDLKHV